MHSIDVIVKCEIEIISTYLLPTSYQIHMVISYRHAAHYHSNKTYGQHFLNSNCLFIINNEQLYLMLDWFWSGIATSNSVRSTLDDISIEISYIRSSALCRHFILTRRIIWIFWVRVFQNVFENKHKYYIYISQCLYSMVKWTLKIQNLCLRQLKWWFISLSEI